VRGGSNRIGAPMDPARLKVMFCVVGAICLVVGLALGSRNKGK